MKFGVDWIKVNGDIALYMKLPQNVNMKLNTVRNAKLLIKIHARVMFLGSYCSLDGLEVLYEV